MQKPRALLTFIIAALALASPLFPLFTTPVSAATTLTASRTFSNMKVDEQATSWWYYTSLRRCVGLNVDGWNWAENDVKSGNWFNGTFASQPERIQYGYYMNGQLEGISTSRQQSGMGTTLNASTTCDKELGELVKKAVAFWGISDSSPGVDPILGLFCEIGARERRDGSDCKNGTGDFRSIPQSSSGRATNFTNVIRQVVYGGVDPSQFARPLAYYYHLRTFMNACAPGKTFLTTQPNGNNVYSVGIPNSQSNQVELRYVVGTESGAARVDTFPDGTERTCEELAKSTLPDGVYATAYNVAVAANRSLAIEQSTIDQIANTNGASSCIIEGVGWIVCPVATFIAKVTDGAYGLAEQLLVFSIGDNPLELNNNPVYTVWSNIRNLANIAFILAFFMIIFSQATSIGLNSYGVKKMLPRLIVAAILVNLSYFLCVLAIDISNIIGAGIDGIISSVPLANTGSSDATWEKVVSAILAGSGTIGAIVIASGASTAGFWALVASALPFLVTALFAIITALVILVARQALLVLLIVVSPLAFVAYILPNTESLFSKWRKLFISLLVFYPFVALIFAGGEMAANILRVSQPDNTFLVIASLAVQVLPLFALPFILRFSGGVLGRIGGMINNPNKGPFDRLRKRAEGYSDLRNKVGRANKINDKKVARNVFGKKKVGADGKPYMVSKRNNLASRMYAGSARRSVMRDEVKRGAEQSLKEKEAEYIADTVQDDYGTALKVAGGDAERVTQVQAYALTAKKKILGERVAAHTTILRDSQVYNSGSTFSDETGAALNRTKMQEALLAGRRVTVTDPTGRQKSLQLGRDPYATEAFIDGYAKQGLSANIREMRDVARAKLAINPGDAVAKMQLEAVNDVIQDNFPSLGTKAPDFYKGVTAFTKSTGAAVAAWKADTGDAAISLMTQTQQAFAAQFNIEHGRPPTQEDIDSFLRNQRDARTSLRSSLQTISNSPDLLGTVDAGMFNALANAVGVPIPTQILNRTNGNSSSPAAANPNGNATGLVSPSGAPLSSANTTPTATSAAPTIPTNPSATPTASTSSTTNPATPPAPTTLADRLAPPLSPTTGTLPPSGALPPTPTPPASTISETQQARQAGGNFGGFNTPPAPQPTTPASEAGSYQDETGAAIPGTVGDPDEYNRRMRGEQP